MSNNLIDQINKLLELGKGDIRRLEHIKSTLEQNKTLYNSDKKYLETLVSKILEEHIQNPNKIYQENIKQKNIGVLKNECCFCNKKISSMDGFKCAYCGLRNCDEHRIPENHDCVNIDSTNRIQDVKNSYDSRDDDFENIDGNYTYKKNKHRPIKVMFIFLIIFGMGAGLIYFDNTINGTLERYITSESSSIILETNNIENTEG